jgi:hypothetical protein
LFVDVNGWARNPKPTVEEAEDECSRLPPATGTLFVATAFDDYCLSTHPECLPPRGRGGCPDGIRGTAA